MGSLTTTVGMLRTEGDSMLRIGTLHDMFVASQNEDKPMVLNLLNLPMASGGVFDPPRFK